MGGTSTVCSAYYLKSSPTVHNSNLLIYITCIRLLHFPVLLHHSPTVLPGITSQTNYLHLKSVLGTSGERQPCQDNFGSLKVSAMYIAGNKNCLLFKQRGQTKCTALNSTGTSVCCSHQTLNSLKRRKRRTGTFFLQSIRITYTKRISYSKRKYFSGYLCSSENAIEVLLVQVKYTSPKNFR